MVEGPEQVVVGAVMQWPEAMAEAGHLTEDHFGNDMAREAWVWIKKIWSEGGSPDLVTVTDRIGGNALGRYGQLCRNVVARNIAPYVEAVERNYIRSRVIQACTEAIKAARTPSTSSEELATAVQSVVDASEGNVDSRPRLLRDLLPEFIDDTDSELPPAPNLFDPLHRETGGFYAGDLIVIAGRPGHGKTALGLQLALAASGHGPSVVFSLEMDSRQLIARTVASDDAPVSLMRERQLDSIAWRAMNERMKQIRDAQLFIQDDTDVTTAKILAQSMAIQNRHGRLSCIMVDYLQLMQAEGRTQNERIAGITRALKKTAKRLQCPVLLLSQLNRDIEKRTKPRPQLSDLRDSGAIEQDADIILFTHRPQLYDRDRARNDVGEIIVAKHRFRKPSTCYVDFHGPSTQWRAADTESIKDHVFHTDSPAKAGKMQREGML